MKISGQSHSCLSHTLRRLTRIYSQPSMTHTRSSKWLPPMASPVTKRMFLTQIAKSSVMGPLASSSRPDSLAGLRRVATSPSRRSSGTSGSRSVRSCLIPSTRHSPVFFSALLSRRFQLPNDAQNRESQIMRLVSRPNIVDLKAFFYSNGNKVRVFRHCLHRLFTS